MGNQKVRMNDVSSFIDPSLVAQANKSKVDNKVVATAGSVVDNKKSQMIDNVGMSREMINKLNKVAEK